jgi:tetratricopeptide (TPR) repeat protein
LRGGANHSILLEKGICRWNNSDVKLEVDVLQFKKLIRQARTEADVARRRELLLKACEVYTGEFLPDMIGEDWIAIENVRYQRMYEDSMQEVLEGLKEEERFEQIYEVSTMAARICPFDDWNLWRIDSLIAMQRYTEAMNVYQKTTRLFFDELGIPPSEELLKRFYLMSERIQQPVSTMEDIRQELKEKERNGGGYYCTYPGFLDCYHVLVRMMERNGASIYMMLCTLTDSKGDLYQESERRQKAVDCLKNAIGRTIRKGDFYTRYNEYQFLLMLPGMNRENCTKIINKIEHNYKQQYSGHYKIQYNVVAVTELEEQLAVGGESAFSGFTNGWA